MSKYFICGHTGNNNRGCEAIIRSTVKVLNVNKSQIYIPTFNYDTDKKMFQELGVYGFPYGNYSTKIQRAFYYAIKKINKYSLAGINHIEKGLFRLIKKGDICLNIGGDTYCNDWPATHIALNQYAKKNSAKSVLWCCSIEKDNIKNKILFDLGNYDYIFAREQLTYLNLLNSGIDSNKVKKVCDPAFFLDTQETLLPKMFIPGNTVGINVSYMILQDNNEIVLENVYNCIDWILGNTDMAVCLIPHVYKKVTDWDDVEILSKIFQKYINQKRVSFVKEWYNCEQLKYIISKCRFFIGARTHSTIAAYSSFVPTIVIGYSVKSKGIATDLFGTYKDYVIPCTEIQDKDCLKNAFLKIVKNEKKIIERLKTFLPEYKKSLTDAIQKYINYDDKDI